MPDKVCRSCHKVTPLSEIVKGSSTCKECKRQYARDTVGMDPGQRREDITKRNYEKRKQFDTQLIEWQEKLQSLDGKLKILTEPQWYNCVRYFNGCAMCDEVHVEVRYQLLPPELKGRYNVLNTIPMCSSCLAVPRRHPNPFEWLAMSTNIGQTTRENILKYLEVTYEKLKNS